MQRPTTPLRRSNSRQSDHEEHYPIVESVLDMAIGEQMAELADGMSALDRNLKDLQVIHTNLNNFNESFSTLIYGLQMNAWCAEFHNGPRSCDFARRKEVEEMEERARRAQMQAERDRMAMQQIQETPTRLPSEPSDGDVTYMRNDNSFIIQPPSSYQSQLPSRIPQSSRASRIRPPNSLRPPRGRGSYLRGGSRGVTGGRGSYTGVGRGSGRPASEGTTRRWL
ncbi:DASH complex subunit DAM1 [Yarrowia lipolytica]|jgi:DASH complex subunit DAM1|uniref:DASH complex subunit DAM1 n=1 Tax=Yarrowia lipolytica TaxID=4952 RepID=A0A371CAP7_YARLL|nr:DASH complex subunit DAM1 [Yarrowia lipolytica]RDW30461.1 DASH complex subunit DAM1 [Yarrowia lipolytica]RDW39471.1 DASH complex subunit DAM1 [Yarrowia lipolytica]RDW48540.1 DASH complex subunit DAM1 [Yarrowia lipolytica]RDW53179.1 DASH complex subunit DAM1 [Yarrowia lipolytica]